MRVFLVRHGKAEDYNSRGDYFRELTKKGVAELKETFKIFKKEKNLDEKNTIIISSPLTRAIETADILVDVLGFKGYQVQDFLSKGDTSRLLEEVKEYSEDRTVILVGHEPDLSRWIEKLTDNYVNVKKGSIHELDIKEDDTADYAGVIFWKNK